MKVFRWKGVVPLALFFVFVGALYLLFADLLVERSVEKAGTALVGAVVDVAEADVRLADGVVMLRGLAVTNPDKPMTNLFEADQIAVNVRVAPLLEKKVIIDTMAVRGLRFGTPRQTSGALARPSASSGELRRSINDWKDRLPVPSFSLDGLRQVVNVDAIAPESLSTLRAARALQGTTDSTRDAWLQRLTQLDPRPTVDSAAALAQRLQGQSVRTLGLAGARDAATSARRTIQELTSLDNRLAALQRGVDSSVTGAKGRLAGLADARRADYQYARGLLKLPVFDAPNLGPALFGRFAAEQAAPVLYWLGMAERYMPPGLQARRRAGPDRVRRSGTTVLFPKREQLPKFLLTLAELSLEIGGTGAAAGAYDGKVTDVTTAPALVGRPTTFTVGRAGGRVGPEAVRIGGTLNHVGAVLRDSLSAMVSGLALPTLTLAPLGVELALGRGGTDLLVSRVGDNLDVRLGWASNAVTWNRLAGGPAAPRDSSGGALPADRLTAQSAARSLRQSAEELVWRTVSGLRDVRIDARLTGSIRQPRLAVGTNVARALADGFRDQLGAELRNTEAQIRARVDALVQERVDQAQAAVTDFQTRALDRVAAERQRLDQVKKDLEARVRALVPGIPGIGG